MNLFQMIHKYNIQQKTGFFISELPIHQ